MPEGELALGHGPAGLREGHGARDEPDLTGQEEVAVDLREEKKTRFKVR